MVEPSERGTTSGESIWREESSEKAGQDSLPNLLLDDDFFVDIGKDSVGERTFSESIIVVSSVDAPKFFLSVVAMGVEYFAAFELSDNFQVPIECNESGVGEVGFPQMPTLIMSSVSRKP